MADADHTNTWNWVEFLADEKGHDLTVVSFNCPRRPLRKVKVIELRGIFSRTKLRYLLCIPELKKILTKVQPSMVLGYRVHSYGFMAAMTGFRPLVLAAQGQNIFYPFDSKVSKLCAKSAIRKADLINSWGDHMTEKLEELGARREIIVTLPRGVRTDLFVPRAKEPNAPFTLVCTRSLHKHYRVDLLIEAMAFVRERGYQARLVLAGDGPHRTELQNLSEHLGLNGNVEFLGFVENKKLPEILGSSDVYVSMVATDGVSASLLEAMSCGLFPIVTDNVANRLWIQEGNNGFLIPEGDCRSLASRIHEAIVKPSLREKAASVNRRMVEERADWIRNMTRMEQGYRDLVGGYSVDA